MSLTELLQHAIVLAWPDAADEAHRLARAAAFRLLDPAVPRKAGLYRESMANLGEFLHKTESSATKKARA